MNTDELIEAEGSFDDPIPEDTGDEIESTAAVDEAATTEEVDDTSEVAAEAESSEPVAESEETPEVTDEVVEDAPKKEPFIPKSRFDSVRARLREAEAKLAEQQKAAAEAPKEESEPTDYDGKLAALTKELSQATLDGDVDKMATLNQQMMATQNEKFTSMLQDTQRTTIDKSQDAMMTNTLVDELVATQPELNPQSESFDSQLVERLNSMRDFYEYQGYTESQALVKTVETLMPQAFEAQVDSNATKAKQTQDSLQKKVAAAAAQPPSASKAGEDSPENGLSSTPDITKMTLDDLDSLSDDQWDVMLGNNG